MLNNVTLPASDPFREEFFPPNGWRCRCTVVQVRKGKYTRSENIRVASCFCDKYGYEIDLLDNPDGVKSADSYNRTLGHEEEYKVSQNDHPTKSSIDNLLRKAKDQADHIVLWIDSDVSLGDLRDAIIDRTRRSESIKDITIVLKGKDCTYTREQIISDGFIIKQADLK